MKSYLLFTIATKGQSVVEKALYKYEVISGEQNLVLSEKGMEHLIYPLDAHKYIDTIVGEPEIIPNGIWNDKVLTQAIYSTSTVGRNIYVTQLYK